MKECQAEQTGEACYPSHEREMIDVQGSHLILLIEFGTRLKLQALLLQVTIQAAYSLGLKCNFSLGPGKLSPRSGSVILGTTQLRPQQEDILCSILQLLGGFPLSSFVQLGILCLILCLRAKSESVACSRQPGNTSCLIKTDT